MLTNGRQAREFEKDIKYGRRAASTDSSYILGTTGPTLSFGFLLFSNTHTKIITKFKISYSKFFIQNFFSKILYSKFIKFKLVMTRTKRTLGRNWTRYHNWYGMNNVLETACSGQLHWTWDTIRQYTLSHAPDVNQVSAQRNAANPPLLPSNDDDEWYRRHPKLPGSGKAPRKLPQAKVPSTSTGSVSRSPRQKARNYRRHRGRGWDSREGSRRSHTGTIRELWLCERSRGTRSRLNSSSGNCLSRGWCENLLKIWARLTFASRAGPLWLCKRPQRLT